MATSIKVITPIYFLLDYNWECGELLPSKGTKNNKVLYYGTGLSVKKEKCASPDEKLVIVWEMWKGRNGRGSYRLEREMYKEYALFANEIARQHRGGGRVSEISYGILDI
jgi:hypothetical protein